MSSFKYKKLGGGTFRLRSGKIVKPNEVFEADENEIPSAFADTLEKLGPAENVGMFRRKGKTASTTPPPPPPVTYTAQPQLDKKGNPVKDKFDIVSADGKPINETALTEEAAQELLKTLM